MADIRGQGPKQDIDEIVRLHHLWVTRIARAASP